MKYEVIALGDICDFTYGDGLKESDRKGGNVPVYGSNGIVGWHDQPLTKGKTIVVGRKGSIGEIHMSKVPCWPIDTTYYVEKTKVPCDFTWLYYMLLALDLTRLNKSAAVPGLNRDDAYEQKLPLPPLPEQRRIAGLLSRADHLRRLRRYSDSLSASLLQSVFLEMFGDPIKNERIWERELLIDVINPDRPITYGILMPGENLSNGIPYVRVVDIHDGKIDVGNVRRTSLEIDGQYKRSKLIPGDLLLTIRGQVGRLAIVPLELNGANITQDTARLASIKSKCNVNFLYGCLIMPSFQHLMQTLTRGVAVTGINLGDVKELPIPLPPLPFQEQFATVVRRVESLRARQSESARQGDELFQALLAQSFGEDE